MENAFFPFSEKEAKAAGVSNRFSFNKETEFPKRLRDLRTKRGETLEVASRAIGTTRSTLGLYEKGDNVPDVKTLVRIAKHYEATTNYLLGEDERPTFDTNYICSKTGLSLKAVEKLCKMQNECLENKDAPDGAELLALNTLLESRKINSFLLLLYSYLFTTLGSIRFKVNGEEKTYPTESLSIVSTADPDYSAYKGVIVADVEQTMHVAYFNMLQNFLTDLYETRGTLGTNSVNDEEPITVQIDMASLMNLFGGHE